MIPTIEQIVEDLLTGAISRHQAIGWLHQHAEGAANDLRDMFAAAALTGLYAGNVYSDAHDWAAEAAYRSADAMLKQRNAAVCDSKEGQ